MKFYVHVRQFAVYWTVALLALAAPANAQGTKPTMADVLSMLIALSGETAVFIAGSTIFLAGSKCEGSDQAALKRLKQNLRRVRSIFLEELNGQLRKRDRPQANAAAAERMLQNSLFDGLKKYPGSSMDERIGAMVASEGCEDFVLPSKEFAAFSYLWTDNRTDGELRRFIGKFSLAATK